MSQAQRLRLALPLVEAGWGSVFATADERQPAVTGRLRGEGEEEGGGGEQEVEEGQASRPGRV